MLLSIASAAMACKTNPPSPSSPAARLEPDRAITYLLHVMAKLDAYPMPGAARSLISAWPVFSAALAIAVVGSITILGAWVFQYGLGLNPCPLCLDQRYAYYFAVPLAVMVVLGDQVGASRKVLVAAMLAIVAGMLWNAGLGIYHAGVEWKWWPGPQECSGSVGNLGSASNLAERLKSIRVVRCDEAAWRFLGLSLAGYNAVISAMLAVIAGLAVAADWRGRK